MRDNDCLFFIYIQDPHAKASQPPSKKPHGTALQGEATSTPAVRDTATSRQPQTTTNVPNQTQNTAVRDTATSRQPQTTNVRRQAPASTRETAISAESQNTNDVRSQAPTTNVRETAISAESQNTNDVRNQAPTTTTRETATSKELSDATNETVESDKENDASRINNSENDLDATLTERRKLNSGVTNYAAIDYSSIDEDSDQSDILRRAEEMGL